MPRKSYSMGQRAQGARFFWSRRQSLGAAHNRAVDALAEAAREWRSRQGIK